jgi:hypothetical protein
LFLSILSSHLFFSSGSSPYNLFSLEVFSGVMHITTQPLLLLLSLSAAAFASSPDYYDLQRRYADPMPLDTMDDMEHLLAARGIFPGMSMIDSLRGMIAQQALRFPNNHPTRRDLITIAIKKRYAEAEAAASAAADAEADAEAYYWDDLHTGELNRRNVPRHNFVVNSVNPFLEPREATPEAEAEAEANMADFFRQATHFADEVVRRDDEGYEYDYYRRDLVDWMQRHL